MWDHEVRALEFGIKDVAGAPPCSTHRVFRRPVSYIEQLINDTPVTNTIVTDHSLGSLVLAPLVLSLAN